MKNKQRNIFIILLLIIVVTSFLYFFKIGSNRHDLFIKQVMPTSDIVEKKQNDEVSIIVSGKSYSTRIKEGDSVYQAMQNLMAQKENNFFFVFKEYPTLGIFIDEINGVKGGDGKYWIYYVNKKEASVGISNYILESGDIINWKLK